ncbi:MAG TPA: alpha/beta fold hydrolase [Steroidobacteraceae bacterium]|nr:alpha/beta fold hydrolase [Steroidobacteraceae bacterium]
MRRNGARQTRPTPDAAELLRHALALQSRLALQWGEALQAAGSEFGARPTADAAAADPLATYDEWVECAERAYARQVRSGEFCSLQAELINTLFAARVANHRAPPAQTQTTGCSLREPVWRRGKAVLYRYLPLPFAMRTHPRPLLVCYAQINRPYVLDLEPERSLIRRLSAAGFTVYLIDWGYPDEAERDTALAEYLAHGLGGAVAHVLAAERVPALDLLGVCQGGTFSLCYTALHPRQIANLVLMVTPVDFQTSGDLLSQWVRGVDTELIRRAGNVPGAVLNTAFLALAPFRLLQQKYVHLLSSHPSPAELERFVRLESWIGDSPDQPATAFAQYLRCFYQENRLLLGKLTLGRQRVRLERVRQPILNIYGTQDRIVPPEASTALRGHTGSRDYAELPVATGHIGMYVSRRAGLEVPQRISAWLAERA